MTEIAKTWSPHIADRITADGRHCLTHCGQTYDPDVERPWASVEYAAREGHDLCPECVEAVCRRLRAASGGGRGHG